jgi:hypothetical protein
MYGGRTESGGANGWWQLLTLVAAMHDAMCANWLWMSEPLAAGEWLMGSRDMLRGSPLQECR